MNEVLKQEINLYQSAFRKERQMFSFSMMLQSTAVVFTLLMAIYVFGLWQVQAIEAEAIRMEGFEKAKSVQLAGLDPTSGIKMRSEIEGELEELTNTLVERQRLIDVLEERPLGAVTGFSEYLKALAEHHANDLWLDHISINGVNDVIELVGQSYDPEAIPSYLRKLGEAPALSGQRFDRFLLERPLLESDGNSNEASDALQRTKEFRFRVAGHAINSTQVVP